MTREEILEKSQNENKGKDVAEIEIAKKGMSLGWLVSVFATAIVTFVNGVVFGQKDQGTLFVMMSGLCAVFLFKFIKLRKRHELFITIAYFIAAICFAIVWIINMVEG